MWPTDRTQWADTDLDGHGDNQAGDAPTPDACPITEGTSTIDRYGCPGRGSDGWSNQNDKLPDEPTQWADSDGDGLGDDWGEALWNASRPYGAPGEWRPGAQMADRCPIEYFPSLDTEGCREAFDPSADGQPIQDVEGSFLGEVGGVAGLAMVGGAVLVLIVLVLLIPVVVRGDSKKRRGKGKRRPAGSISAAGGQRREMQAAGTPTGPPAAGGMSGALTGPP